MIRAGHHISWHPAIVLILGRLLNMGELDSGEGSLYAIQRNQHLFFCSQNLHQNIHVHKMPANKNPVTGRVRSPGNPHMIVKRFSRLHVLFDSPTGPWVDVSVLSCPHYSIAHILTTHTSRHIAMIVISFFAGHTDTPAEAAHQVSGHGKGLDRCAAVCGDGGQVSTSFVP